MGKFKLAAGLGAAVLFASSTFVVTAGAVAAPAPPKPPTISSIVGTDGAVTVTWTAPTSSNPITGYTASVVAGDRSCTTSTLSCTISGLTNFTPYSFVVRATSAAGTSLASLVQKATPYSTPLAPVLGLGTLTKTTLTIPFTSSDPAVGATYKWSVNGVTQPILKKVEPLVVKNLVAGTTYNVSVQELFGTAQGAKGSLNFQISSYTYPLGKKIMTGLIGSNLMLGGWHLSGANLNGANLSGSNLSYVTSGGVTGTPASLPSGWSIMNGYLIGPYANLAGANLAGADLSVTNLSGANLTGADLSNAYLGQANLTGADLSAAELSNAYLGYANLSGINLSGADLTGAHLSGAILYNVTSGGIIGTPASLPSGWSFVNGYLIG